MGKIALGLKINLSKIDMARVFNGKDGAQYLDMTIFVNMDELDQYGNSGMITQDVSKDEKAQGVKGNILGNGNVFWVENGQAPQKAGSNQGQQQAPAQGGFVPQQQGGFQQQAPQQQLNQAPQQQGGFQAQAPQAQAPQAQQPARDANGFTQQQGGFQQQAPQTGYPNDGTTAY